MTGKKRYSREKKDTVICLLGARFWQLRLEKKMILSKKRYITSGKKRYSRLSDGCAVLAITTGKKDTVVSGNFHHDWKKKDTIRPEKKRYSRLWWEISIFL